MNSLYFRVLIGEQRNWGEYEPAVKKEMAGYWQQLTRLGHVPFGMTLWYDRGDPDA